MLTQERLKEILHYCPETGVFTRKIASCNRVKTGDVAGSMDGRGYLGIYIGKLYSSHRLAFLYMTGEFPINDVDHINGERNDNRWENLRHVTRSENHRNRRLSPKNTSGHTGVIWLKKNRKWAAVAMLNYKKIHIGCFDSIDSAIAARKLFNIENGFHINHGEKA
jgi:hypothetical protein